MKQVMGASMGLDCQHDMIWEESVGDKRTWLGYVSFGSLRHTAWWDETYKAVLFSIAIPDMGCEDICSGFGVRLGRRKSGICQMETSTDSFEYSDGKNEYTHNFKIEHDSMYALSLM